eukprot:TRINITY_DN4274_c0_g1_i1.p1 TRINITY_DN4274_c0_g1~~TRINITY_DN4274_c0_g1_i1.p1  ORF type:complete len:212 (+),score=28.25 TRINITY_DN4274_c0_g1_i1:191-826(+)
MTWLDVLDVAGFFYLILDQAADYALASELTENGFQREASIVLAGAITSSIITVIINCVRCSSELEDTQSLPSYALRFVAFTLIEDCAVVCAWFGYSGSNVFNSERGDLSPIVFAGLLLTVINIFLTLVAFVAAAVAFEEARIRMILISLLTLVWFGLSIVMVWWNTIDDGEEDEEGDGPPLSMDIMIPFWVVTYLLGLLFTVVYLFQFEKQ